MDEIYVIFILKFSLANFLFVFSQKYNIIDAIIF
jgi:hypothetical protein